MEFAQLAFEQPIYDLNRRIEELKKLSAEGPVDFADEIETLSAKLEQLKEQVYANLTIWQRVQVARHPQRPYTLDYVQRILTDWVELHGDRNFADDHAMVTAWGGWRGGRWR